MADPAGGRRDRRLRDCLLVLTLGTIVVVVAAGLFAPRAEFSLSSQHVAAEGLPLERGLTYRPLWALVAVGGALMVCGVIGVAASRVRRQSSRAHIAALTAVVNASTALIVAHSVRLAEPTSQVQQPGRCKTWPRTGCI